MDCSVTGDETEYWPSPRNPYLIIFAEMTCVRLTDSHKARG